MAGGMLLATAASGAQTAPLTRPVRIRRALSNFERDPLLQPFGFKGGYMTEKWQIATYLESDSGHTAVGLCSQSVLWADGEVFAAHSEAAGNALMYAMLDQTLQRLPGTSFANPIDLLLELWPETYRYGVRITGRPDLRETFALMALVSLDNAAWLLYALENGFDTYDAMIPEVYRPALSERHSAVASIPLISYATPMDEVRRLVNEGHFFLKLKIGQPGTEQEMLAMDQQQLERVHRAIGGIENPYTRDGKPRYYLDANGRYAQRQTLEALLDHAQRIGALGQIAVVEEPFPEESGEEVAGLGVLVAADESAHTDASAAERIQRGYSAIAIKGAAKTLSMSLRILRLAREHGIPCFCADSTAIPILVDWNKNLAARLPAFPGLDIGLVETNGAQNYADWERLVSYHPYGNATWNQAQQGVFPLDDAFYRHSGGIFAESPHYRALFA